MPTPPKASENMNKHMTQAEQDARQKAEEGILPDRGREVTLKMPAIMAGNTAAKRYWKNVLERMDGLVILDDLDSDTLGVYCVMMARYEVQCKLLTAVSKQLKAAKDDAEKVEAAAARISEVNGKMQSLERNILQYAEKLGLTPSGRIRLAQKRADRAAEAADSDSDLYGD